MYLAQIRKPANNDWALTVKQDIEDIGLNLTDEAIEKIKKEPFKTQLKQKIIEASFKYLTEVKESHSKFKIFVIKIYIFKPI